MLENPIAHFSALCIDSGASSSEDFDFYVEPKSAEFSAETGGASRHLMVNGTNHRIAIKVKCSNNRLYKVSPVYLCLDPGKAKRLQVLREPGEYDAKDKLVLIYKATHLRNAKHAFQSDSSIGDDDDMRCGGSRFDSSLQPKAPKKKLIMLWTIPASGLQFTRNELGSLTNSTPSHSADANPPTIPSS